MLSFIRVYKSKLETSGMQFNFPPENLSSAVKHRMVMQRYYALQDAHVFAIPHAIYFNFTLDALERTIRQFEKRV